ncbi:putative lactoylglutathione lyase [Jannaschia seosinensis]|uniref:Putative lactoylglutathione lyase n=1 Tax=Jannaschia seosinensis TaxID=313367 RepID=A0A0M7BAG9_9RHOB|nr:VOC family protein [Jannaschia seosinensis]CUH34183.1 putative lactoylglutathione lyase [Jannaschia seosinensis]
MTPNRINLVTLGVRDVAAARAFYECLGWKAEDSPPTVAFFDCGSFKFGLFGHDDLAAEMGRPPEDLGRGAVTLAVNWPSEAAVDTAFARALQAGATEIRAPRRMDWGGHSGYWSDPDGHVWEYAFNPFWKLDPEGRLATS